MAWVGQGWRGTGLWLLVAAVGCSTINPAYDDTAADGGEASNESGSSDPGSTGDTIPEPDDGTVGSDDGTTAPEPVECTQPVPGAKVIVEPQGGPPRRLCNGIEESRGLLSNDGNYHLFLDPQCLPNDDMVMVFSPKGPPVTNGNSTCVDYRLAYRADCTLDHAIMIDLAGLLYMASTSPFSPAPELLEIHPMARPGVCNCSQAVIGSCCDEVDLDVGPYALSLRLAGTMEELTVTQGSQVNLTIGDREYEFVVPQARVTNECGDPVQFDWFLRRLAL